MKKFLLSLFTLSALTFLSATAQTAQKASGTYTGDLYIQLDEPISDETEPLTDQNITLTVSADGQGIDFCLPNFSFGDAVLGDILLPGISVSEQNYKVTFGENAARTFNFLDGMIQAEANLEPSTSYISLTDNTVYVDVNVAWTNAEDYPDNRCPIYVRFIGKNNNPPAGISSVVEAGPARTAIHTIDGRRVSRMAKGVYIVNGKKIIK